EFYQTDAHTVFRTRRNRSNALPEQPTIRLRNTAARLDIHDPPIARHTICPPGIRKRPATVQRDTYARLPCHQCDAAVVDGQAAEEIPNPQIVVVIRDPAVAKFVNRPGQRTAVKLTSHARHTVFAHDLAKTPDLDLGIIQIMI